MTTFRVWAPDKRTVHVDIDGHRTALRPAGGGWWRAEVARAGPGTDYQFSLDGGPLRPDPRSAWQPAGVFGPSRVVDHAAFAWTDAGWQPPPLDGTALIYELHVGTFTPNGTFAAAIERLPHLRDLGVTHVELMPVQEFSGMRGWGYDGVDLFAPHHAYGGPDGLKALVDACHAHGLAVLIDVVYNHLGPAGNFLAEFGPYFTDRYATPWGAAINLDGRGSDEVRRFLCDNAAMWLRDYHADGLRLDAVHAIVDTSATHLLEQLAVETAALAAALGRRLVLIAESDLNDPRLLWPRARGGYGLDAQWSDDFHHALHAALSGERDGYYADFGTLADVATALQHAYVYAGRYSPFRGRTHGRAPTGVPGHAFLGYLQNHDQIGNRARGERSARLMSLGRLKIGAALVLTAPFVPMLFQGEEWAASTPFPYFSGHEDVELGRAVSEGRRREFAAFGWDPATIPDPQDAATFASARLRWEELDEPLHREMLDWHRALIALRRSLPALADGNRDAVRTSWNDEDGWLVVHRGPVTVAANLSLHARRVLLAVRGAHVALASNPAATVVEGWIALPPESVAVLV